ncbi:hypothetical protein F0160_03685 [Paraburkholderia sp. JPY303]|uniref:DUF1488 family protein n=1 Tax=Paraburkholderia atlantica TaxID=2654982 RepID=A0A7W8QA72_PARAM|nr:hypothetical protein [Paraburkholderia atlantica]MBB5426590.1 hypothetical protein [Paraburkholderia atlantica]NUY29623.1 hypothetical protein [Paraburkholderia atlantica]
MSSIPLIWAAVPHNSDGVVFQIQLGRGLQRFHVSRRVLEDVFELERKASDARQLEFFYVHEQRILARASAKRATASSTTVSLQPADFGVSNDSERWARSSGIAHGLV